MIKIVEATPRKLSGKTSLFISFDYNPNIVDAIKHFPPAVYNKKNMTWEVATYHLGKLVDKLVFFDDIELSAAKDDEIREISSARNLSENEIKEFKVAPFAHQVDGINFMLNKEKCLLLDSMGLG